MILNPLPFFQPARPCSSRERRCPPMICKGLIAWLKSNPDKATWGGTLIAPFRAFRTWWLVRSTCARGTPRPPKGGDREVVADHQGGWDQGGSEPRRPVWVIT